MANDQRWWGVQVSPLIWASSMIFRRRHSQHTYPRFSVPETNFALSLGGCGRIRYLHEQPGTCVYLMDNSTQSVALMKAKIVSSSTILLKFQKLPGVYTSKGKYIQKLYPLLSDLLICRFKKAWHPQSWWRIQDVADNVGGKQTSPA